MATTRIMPIHPKMTWGAAQTIKHVTDYVMDPAKTNDGLLVTGFACDPDIIKEDFMLSRDEYLYETGREQGKNEILAYHVRQSFLPGEADAETISRLGYELGMALTDGNHAFIVCTHIDKAHVHNHIIINAVNLDCDGKYRNELGSYKRVQKIADRISSENNLSVVENPNLSKGTNNRYRNTSKREGFVQIIDEVLEKHRPDTFERFLKLLEKNGCKVKRRGKTISVQPPGAERFIRFRAGQKGLPKGYDEESLRKKIAEMKTVSPERPVEPVEQQAEMRDDYRSDPAQTFEDFTVDVDAGIPITDDVLPVADKKTMSDTYTPVNETPVELSIISPEKKINLLIDIEKSIKAQGSPGYERWAKGFNLQQAAETLLFLQTNNLTDMAALTQAAEKAETAYNALQNRINAADTRIKEVNTLQRHIGAYRKNADIYSQYQRTKRNLKFRKENEKAIITVEEAKAYFDATGIKKIPTVKELQAEYSALSQEKNSCYQTRNEMRRQVLDLQSAKKNAEALLGGNGEPSDERTQKGKRDLR